eukprot:scaffold5064_cov115-Isochrysis_galbana.AAC.13
MAVVPAGAGRLLRSTTRAAHRPTEVASATAAAAARQAAPCGRITSPPSSAVQARNAARTRELSPSHPRTSRGASRVPSLSTANTPPPLSGVRSRSSSVTPHLSSAPAPAAAAARTSSKVARGTQTAVRVENVTGLVTAPRRSGYTRVMVNPSFKTPRSRIAAVRLKASVHRWPRLSMR